MRSDKPQTGKSSRQKIIAVIFIVIVLFLLWQVYGMFKGGSINSSPSLAGPPAKEMMSATTPGGPMPPPPMPTPQAAQITQQPPIMSQRELELMQLQQQTEARYLAAINELQMLKLSREIAETNQAIAAAKLSTVTSEKRIVDLLKPEPPVQPASYSKNLLNPNAVTVQQVTVQQVAEYSVISVSELQNRWSAVLGSQGNLYHVSVGDILPPDSSKVIYINRSGVVLEKNGVKKKISLVPII